MKDRKNKVEKEMAIAINTGVVAVGAERKVCAFSGSTERSASSRGWMRCKRLYG